MVQKKFRQSSETAIASYNFIDIAEGTGIVLFFGFDSETSAGLDYHLITQSDSYTRNIGTSNSGDPLGTLDLDFDLTQFNLPQRIEGTAYVSIGVYYQSVVSGVGTGTGTVKLIKVDADSNETEIVSVTLPNTAITGGATEADTHVLPLTVPFTHFKKGETLRLSISISLSRASGSGAMVVGLGHDPKNRDWVNFIVPSTDDKDTTQIRAYIPFKLDL